MHGLERTEKIRLLEINTLNAVKICRPWAKDILNDRECIRIFKNWFPLIFAYPSLFQQVAQRTMDESTPQEPLPSLREISQEAFEDIWLEKETVIKTNVFFKPRHSRDHDTTSNGAWNLLRLD
jgi:hypothetical protein